MYSCILHNSLVFPFINIENYDKFYLNDFNLAKSFLLFRIGLPITAGSYLENKHKSSLGCDSSTHESWEACDPKFLTSSLSLGNEVFGRFGGLTLPLCPLEQMNNTGELLYTDMTHESIVKDSSSLLVIHAPYYSLRDPTIILVGLFDSALASPRVFLLKKHNKT